MIISLAICSYMVSTLLAMTLPISAREVVVFLACTVPAATFSPLLPLSRFRWESVAPDPR